VRLNRPPALRLRTYSQGENSASPTKRKAKQIQWGPLDSLSSILLVSMNYIWVLKNKWYILLFSYLENLYDAKGRERYERTPDGVHFAVFPIYIPLVNENWDFKIILTYKFVILQKQVINSCLYVKIS